ncbi:sugar phosphate isomerase/epimerase family protein [Marinicrinis lubricantis]|uniref:Sugar phosphate isomerase/epimerase family protein n=1 Tax=Marinicrinis lubricantis TaxID=2086470 RepID=A0ABW1IKB6_9BACL
MIWDRLGIITDEVSGDLTEALDWAADRELKHVEIRTIGGRNIVDFTDGELSEVIQEVEGRGLFVSAISSPLFKCALDPQRPVMKGDTFGQEEEDIAAHFAKLHRFIDIADQLKTNRIRVFSFWREQNPRDYEEEITANLRKAADIAEQHGKLLLLENEPSCNGGFAEEVARIVMKVQSDALRALWDPGNEQYGGRSSYPEGYAHVRKLTGHVHLKDALFLEDGEPSCVPIGTGKVPFAAMLNALQEDGYSGLYTIETHFIPEGRTAMEGSELTLQGLKGLLKRIAVDL